MYVHRNPLARWIFWSRLHCLYDLIKRHSTSRSVAADVGGGSGAFLLGLTSLFDSVDVLDFDCSDAEKIKTKYDLSTATLIEGDIEHIPTNNTYGTFVFADVLEHFSDLNVPIRWIKHHATKQGKTLLAVSLPTENWVYKLGRIILRKSKPVDHYHCSADVLDFFAKAGFIIIERNYCPTVIFDIPLFEIAILRYERSIHDQ